MANKKSDHPSVDLEPLLPEPIPPPPEAEAIAVEVNDVPIVQGDERAEVVAPADLSAGYHLSVNVNGRAFVVVVPEGGVKEGDRFMAAVVSSEDTEDETEDPHNIPTGAWRDGICDCCIHGCCHPMCCLSLWCRACALGQVMTRMGLDWTGTPINRRRGTWSAFRVLFCITGIYWCFRLYLYPRLLDASITNRMDKDTFHMMQQVFSTVNLLFFIFILILLTRVRAYVRRKYAIREQYCTGCEDCCLAFFCSCCAVSQLARHTADYRTYRAACCTENGLSEEVPHVV